MPRYDFADYMEIDETGRFLETLSFSLIGIHQFLKDRSIILREVKAHEEDALDIIALDEYGDERYAKILAYVNRIENIHDVPCGTQLQIPLLTDIEAFATRNRQSTRTTTRQVI